MDDRRMRLFFSLSLPQDAPLSPLQHRTLCIRQMTRRDAPSTTSSLLPFCPSPSSRLPLFLLFLSVSPLSSSDPPINYSRRYIQPSKTSSRPPIPPSVILVAAVFLIILRSPSTQSAFNPSTAQEVH
jgi:hypothetical protein